MTKILIVGEAYGEKEDMFKHPFVGASGRELANMLCDADFCSKPAAKWPSEIDMIHFWKNLKKDKEIELTNVFNEHPEENEIDLFFKGKKDDVCLDIPPLKAGKYLLKDYRHHFDALINLVKELNPVLIIAVGAVATWALTDGHKFSEIRGTIFWNDDLKVKILSTYHPAAVLRNWSLRTVCIADLIKAKQESSFREVRRTKRYILVDPTLDEIEAWLNKPAEIYSVDIETAYALYSKAELAWMNKNCPSMLGILSRQISMVGFASTPTDAMVIPFMARKPATENRPASLNYWETQGEEVRAWKLLQFGLRKAIPKLFQNGMFDMQRLFEAGVHTYMPREDSMILHHALFPEFQKGLGFLGSLYSQEPAWKGMRSFGDTLKADE